MVARAAQLLALTLALAGPSPRAFAAAPNVSADGVWRELGETVSAERTGALSPRTFGVQLDRVREQLSGAPAEGADLRRGAEFTLPLPDGRMARFRAVETPILGPEVRRANPDAHTYLAVGADEPGLTARVELTALGVRAMVFTPDGTALLDPLERGRADRMTSTWMRDEDLAGLDCEVIERAAAIAPRAGAEPQSIGGQLRTFRFILTATGEWTQALGGASAATATMITQIDRVNAIFERDIAVRLQAVQLRPFPSAATDPYVWASYFDLLDRNTVVVDSIYGEGSYDQGEILTVIPGAKTRGVSYTPVVCVDGEVAKAGSVVATTAAGSLEEMLTMGHELGHAIGNGSHTQDASCNRSSITPYEIGSGITVLCSMPAACPPDFQPQRESFYHAGTIQQMLDYLATIPDCGTTTATGNTAPSVDAGPDCTVPRGTPFVLSGTASDPDAGDAVTYGWDEMDVAPTAADSVLGPLFRWRLPTVSPTRPIPALATLLSGATDPFERLPNADRTLHFRLIARDNHPGGGGVAWDDKVITVSGAPFAVTFPNGGNTLTAGVPFTVTWSVGGGSISPTVNILLSTDGGTSWVPLSPGTPNDGSETVTCAVPATHANCRIKVESVGNIFYDVSNANFTIVGAVTATDPQPVPSVISLRPVWPNPMAGNATIGFDLPAETELDLAMFTAAGARVRTLAAGRWPAGSHTLNWNGQDERGGRLPAGLYFVRLRAGGRSEVSRFVMIR